MRDILHSIYYYFNKGLRKLYFLSKKIIRYERITPEHLLVIIGVAVAANTCNQTKEQVIVAKSSADSLYKISKQQLMESKSSSDSSLSLAKQQLKLAIEQMKKQTISDSVGDARTIEALTISKQTMESNQENEYWRAQNEYASRRAYLVVNQVILIDSIEINKSVTAKATIANRSNTPALNVRMYSSILSQSEYDTLTLDHAYSTLQTNNSIFIGVDEYKTVYRYYYNKLDSATYTRLYNGSEVYYLYSLIYFEDIFYNSHLTEYLHKYNVHSKLYFLENCIPDVSFDFLQNSEIEQ